MRPGSVGAHRKTHGDELVAIVVVIVLIPITIGAPAMAVFIPPTMALVPAAFPRLVQIVASAVRLPAVPAVMLHGFVQFVIGFGDAALATTVVIGEGAGRSGERQHPQQGGSGQQHFSEKPLRSSLKRHSLPILQFLPRPEWGLGGPPSYQTRVARRVLQRSDHPVNQ